MKIDRLILLSLVFIFSRSAFSKDRPLCSEISDKFCLRVWSPPYNGNFKFNKKTSIQLGKSEKSDLSMATKLNYLALIESEPRLPKDFRNRVHLTLKDLKKHLSSEKDDDLWYIRLEPIMNQIAKIIDEVTVIRFRKKFPELAKIPVSDRNFDQNWEFKKIQIDLNSQIIRAKYETSENWKRVVRVFEQVRKDMLLEIKNLNLSEEMKNHITERVSNIKLRFPDEDPRKINFALDCGSSLRNAFYMFSRNSFTVCAGWFNSVQDDAALTFMIAHEMAHAFDPQAYAISRFIKTDIGKVFSKMCGVEKPIYSCEEWADIRKKVFVKQPHFQLVPPPYEKLTKCLKSDKELKPFQIAEVSKINEDNQRRYLHQYAVKNEFTLLANPTKFKDGRYKPNDYFLRPDRWRIKDSDQICVDDVDFELMGQIMKCAQYDEKDPKARAQKFEESLKELEQIRNVAGELWLSFCGKDCGDLVVSKHSRVVHEEFADWMAKKILEVFLAREKSIEERRQALGAAGVWLCDRPGLFWGASDLTEVEKKWSFESHPDDRVRRLSLITPRVAELLNCDLGKNSSSIAPTCNL